MEYIVSSMWIFLEMLSLYFCCNALLLQRSNGMKIPLLLLVAGILSFITNNINIYIFYYYPVLQVLASILISLFFSSVAFQDIWYKHLIAVALYHFSLGAVDTTTIYGTAAILGISASTLIWKKWRYTVVGTTGKCIFLFLMWALFYIRRKKVSYNLSRKRLMLVFVFPLISIFMLYAIFDGYKTLDDLSASAVVFSAILGISNFVFVYLMSSLDRATRAEQEIALLSQSMALQSVNFQALEKSYRAQRAATHEFKNQLQAIYNLLKSGETIAAQDYIAQLQSEHSSRLFAVNTKHPVVDAVLNEKYRVAREHNIDISFKVNDLSCMILNTDAIVVMLSNLLDNAIEACQRLPERRKIDCTLLLEDSLFLSIRNTSLPVTIINEEIETSKEPKSEHGFGLACVRRILAQINGEFDMNYSTGWFQFTAEIPQL